MTSFIKDVYCGFCVFGKPSFSAPIVKKISQTEAEIDNLSKKMSVLPINEQRPFNNFNAERKSLNKIKKDLGEVIGAARAITAFANMVLFGTSLGLSIFLDSQVVAAVGFTGFALNTLALAPLYLTYRENVTCFDYEYDVDEINKKLNTLNSKISTLYNNSVLG